MARTFDFQKIEETLHWTRWQARCHDVDLVAVYDLTLHALLDSVPQDMRGDIRTLRRGRHAPSLIQFTVYELEKLVQEIGSFGHTVTLNDNAMHLVPEYVRNKYDQLAVDIYHRQYT